MNIDVKNSLNKVFPVCNNKELKTCFVSDIYSTISFISKRNSDFRCDYFNKVYLNGEYPLENHSFDDTWKMPKIISEIDNDSVELMKSFFMILCKSYVTDFSDRKDIDIKKVTRLFNEFGNVKKIQSRSCNECVSNNESDSKTVEATDTRNSETETELEPEQTLEELLEELNSLIGLNAVKKEIENRINLIKLQKKGEEFGAMNFSFSHHLVFFGNPGTGKTTVARLLSKIYKALGVLSIGQLVEVDRGSLVAGYVGQTAIKTQEAINKAEGGVLFIDEAYTLIHGKGENDFGKEAVDTILKAMEDNRDKFIVIVAGYTNLMKEFIKSNPGLQSRFKNYISFDDYSVDELLEIFRYHCCKYGHIICDGADSFLREYFERLKIEKADNFANGREIRNYYENVIQTHANRLSNVIETINEEDYYLLTMDDLKSASEIRSEI